MIECLGLFEMKQGTRKKRERDECKNGVFFVLAAAAAAFLLLDLERSSRKKGCSKK